VDSFTYCWTDHKTTMLYVGIHKGSYDDGYVCSSKHMLHEYKKRPQDFTREVLANGTYTEMCKFETAILKSVDAVKNESFYNRAINNGKGLNLKPCSNYTKEKISKANIGKPKLAARGPRPGFTGTGNHFYGKSHLAETKEIMSVKAKARSQGSSNNNAMTVEINNVTYYTMKEAAAALNTTNYKIRQMLNTGEARRTN
jgi:hypothetical protein